MDENGDESGLRVKSISISLPSIAVTAHFGEEGQTLVEQVVLPEEKVNIIRSVTLPTEWTRDAVARP